MMTDDHGNPVPDAVKPRAERQPQQSPDELIAMYELTPCAWAGCFVAGVIFGVVGMLVGMAWVSG